jgi:4-aminobutyrate aminotransferase-like enzyme
MMWGIQCVSSDVAAVAMTAALQEGVIILSAGVRGDVLSIAPPLVISEEQLRCALDTIARSLR